MTFCSTEATADQLGVWKVRAMPRVARTAGMPGGSESRAQRQGAGLAIG